MKYGTWMALATLLAGMTACNNAQQQNTPENNAKEQQAPAPRNIIRKPISVPDEFSFITNLGSVDIIYTQGPYSVEAEGDSTTLGFLQAEVDSHLMTVNVLSDNNTEMNKYGNTSNIKLYVSCPELKCISICGNGGFECQGTWKAEEVQLGMMGTGNMKLGKVECSKCDLQSSAQGSLTIDQLTADDVVLFSYGSADIDITFDVNSLVVLNEGKQHMHFRGNAKKVAIKKPDDHNLINELKMESIMQQAE